MKIFRVWIMAKQRVIDLKNLDLPRLIHGGYFLLYRAPSNQASIQDLDRGGGKISGEAQNFFLVPPLALKVLFDSLLSQANTYPFCSPL